MFDQSHNLKNKIEATIQSAVMVQETYAKALSVDYAALQQAQQGCDVLSAEEILLDAYKSDVRADLSAWRECKGIAANPLQAFRASGYTEQMAAEREARHGPATAGGGYQ